MSTTMTIAIVMATISGGHVDLSDLLMLLAFLAFAVAIVVEVMSSPVDIGKVLTRAGLAMLALALFVL